ncbi:MAG: MTH1187 family thiamine-binding protein [Geobacteraceae bacterium]|nr:MTH1187 family thiamine-binding protein [Geobacteraceae bacterium]
MKVLVDLCIVPIGVGVSLSPYIAACEKVLTEAGLKTSLHSYGTNIEGEWDAVFAAIRRCHEVVHGMGAPRITTTIKLGTRTDRDQTRDPKGTLFAGLLSSANIFKNRMPRKSRGARGRLQSWRPML